MRQISVLDKKKDFFISLGTKPLMEMEDEFNISVHIARIKIESICFKLVESVLLIAYAILSICSRQYVLTTTVSYFLNDKKHFRLLSRDD
jgi:hypothetical protein